MLRAVTSSLLEGVAGSQPNDCSSLLNRWKYLRERKRQSSGTSSVLGEDTSCHLNTDLLTFSSPPSSGWGCLQCRVPASGTHWLCRPVVGRTLSDFWETSWVLAPSRAPTVPWPAWPGCQTAQPGTRPRLPHRPELLCPPFQIWSSASDESPPAAVASERTALPGSGSAGEVRSLATASWWREDLGCSRERGTHPGRWKTAGPGLSSGREPKPLRASFPRGWSDSYWSCREIWP